MNDSAPAEIGHFPELVPQGYRARALEGGLAGPLARMIREEAGEYAVDPGDLADPTGEGSLSIAPRLIRKYRDRALYLATGECVVHCRFCFRRGSTLLGRGAPDSRSLFAAAEAVASIPEITEVIISGGDPLSLSDADLVRILAAFGRIPTVTGLRIHTKAPVAAPGRVTPGLLTALNGAPKPVRVVLHVNHSAELSPSVLDAIRALKASCAEVGFQSVLLNGVNASPPALSGLFRACSEAGLSPRHLHHPDRTPGNAGFRVSLREGLAIYRSLAGPGIGSKPEYVVDLPNGSGKALVRELKEVSRSAVPEGVVRRYRWERPAGWKGMAGAESFEWDDIPEDS